MRAVLCGAVCGFRREQLLTAAIYRQRWDAIQASLTKLVLADRLPPFGCTVGRDHPGTPAREEEKHLCGLSRLPLPAAAGL